MKMESRRLVMWSRSRRRCNNRVKTETSGLKKENELTGDLEVIVADLLLLTGQDPAS